MELQVVHRYQSDTPAVQPDAAQSMHEHAVVLDLHRDDDDDDLHRDDDDDGVTCPFAPDKARHNTRLGCRGRDKAEAKHACTDGRWETLCATLHRHQEGGGGDKPPGAHT